MQTIADHNAEQPIPIPEAITEIVRQLGGMPNVIAIVIAGSITAATADAQSDVDIYVYGPEPPPLDLRIALALQYDPHPEIDNRAFGPGDEWEVTGLGVDLIYWSPDWIENQLSRVLDHHLPSTGYTTSFWRTILHSQIVFDPSGWFAALHQRAQRPYPEELRTAIISLNHPLLRTARSSYLHQIERAITRRDVNSVQHRTTALLASYFDILFALNRVPHPGEKRLIAFVERECPLRPAELDRMLHNLIASIPPPWDQDDVIRHINALVDSLDALLLEHGPPLAHVRKGGRRSSR